MIIYKITNKKNGKIYIGQTVQVLEARWKAHLNHKFNSAIKNAVLKHGKENFSIEQIDAASNIEELNEKEIYWIAKLESNDRNKGYNLNSGGKNAVPNEEVKEKMRRAHLGKKRTPEQCKAISKRLMGHKHSEETKRKIAQKATGRKRNYKMTEDHRRLMQEGKNRSNYVVSEETKKKISLSSKGKRLGIPKSEEMKERISNTLKGKMKGIKKPEGMGAKVSAALKGKPKTKEHIEKRRQTMLKKKLQNNK